MRKSLKHWHGMNGSQGCIPDYNEVYSSKESAISSMCSLFDEVRGLKTDLALHGFHNFKNRHEAGADYAEVFVCRDADCMEGN